MCLAIPMQVLTLDGDRARCGAAGVERDVSLFLLQDEPITVGDHVLVHVGYAIQRIDSTQAEATWALFEQMLEREGDR